MTPYDYDYYKRMRAGLLPSLILLLIFIPILITTFIRIDNAGKGIDPNMILLAMIIGIFFIINLTGIINATLKLNKENNMTKAKFNYQINLEGAGTVDYVEVKANTAAEAKEKAKDIFIKRNFKREKIRASIVNMERNI